MRERWAAGPGESEVPIVLPEHPVLRMAAVGLLWPEPFSRRRLDDKVLVDFHQVAEDLIDLPALSEPDLASIEAARLAAERCGLPWPASNPAEPAHPYAALDAPALWGVWNIWLTLTARFMRPDTSVLLGRAMDASRELARMLERRIGLRTVDSAQSPPSAVEYVVAWRDFDMSLAAYQPILILPAITRDASRPPPTCRPDLRLVDADESEVPASSRDAGDDGPHAA